MGTMTELNQSIPVVPFGWTNKSSLCRKATMTFGRFWQFSTRKNSSPNYLSTYDDAKTLAFVLVHCSFLFKMAIFYLYLESWPCVIFSVGVKFLDSWGHVHVTCAIHKWCYTQLPSVHLSESFSDLPSPALIQWLLWHFNILRLLVTTLNSNWGYYAYLH